MTSAARIAPAPSDAAFPAWSVTPDAGTITRTFEDCHAHMVVELGFVPAPLPVSPKTLNSVSAAITGTPPAAAREQRNPPARTDPTRPLAAAEPCKSVGMPEATSRPPMSVARSNDKIAASTTSNTCALNRRGASTISVSIGRFAGWTTSRICTRVLPIPARGFAKLVWLVDREVTVSYCGSALVRRRSANALNCSVADDPPGKSLGLLRRTNCTGRYQSAGWIIAWLDPCTVRYPTSVIPAGGPS